LTPHERDLILGGLFELTITYAEDDETRRQDKALAPSSVATRTRSSTAASRGVRAEEVS
jgi:hypothetical protein